MKDKISLVSVVVPVYNCEKYLEKSIDSILNQTHSDIELILVNDGSTDNSIEILNKYIDNPKCIVIHQQNKGAHAARNAGLDIASGKYVYIIDSDDFVGRKAIELLVERMEETNADFCCYRFSFVDEKTGCSRIFKQKFEFDLLTDKEIMIKDAFFAKNIKTASWNKFYLRSFIEDNHLRFFTGIVHEDCLFSILSAIYAKKIAFLDVPLYFTLVRSGSRCRNIKEEALTSYFYIFDEIQKVLIQNNIFHKYEKYYFGGYVKHILFILFFSAFRLEKKRQYLDFFSLLKGNIYCNTKIGKNIKYYSRICYCFYLISLSPRLFYWSVCLFRKVGYKLY